MIISDINLRYIIYNVEKIFVGNLYSSVGVHFYNL